MIGILFTILLLVIAFAVAMMFIEIVATVLLAITGLALWQVGLIGKAIVVIVILLIAFAKK